MTYKAPGIYGRCLDSSVLPVFLEEKQNDSRVGYDCSWNHLK